MGPLEKPPLISSTEGSSITGPSPKVQGKKRGGLKKIRETAQKLTKRLSSDKPETLSYARKLKARFAGPSKKKTEAVSEQVLTPSKKSAELLPPKLERARDIGARVVAQKTTLLRAVYLKLKISLVKGVKSPRPFTAFHGVGVGLGLLNIGPSLSELGLAIGNCCLEIKNLRRNGQATPKNVLKAISKATIIDRLLVRDLTSLAFGTLVLVHSVGSLTHKLSPAVLASLGIAMTALGAAAAGLTALFGVVKTGMGIKQAISAQKKVKNAEKRLQDFKTSLPPIPSRAQKLTLIRLETTIRMAKKERTQAILKACLGTFVTVGGALSMAAFFTEGATAIALVIVGLVVGITATTVHIANLVYQKRSQKQLDKEFHATLSTFPLEGTDWEALAKEMNLDPAMPQEQREQALKDYCFSVVPPHRPIQPAEPGESAQVDISLD